MKISLSPVNFITNVTHKPRISFGSASLPQCDAFIRSESPRLTEIDNGRGGKISGEIVKDVSFSDRNGKKVNGFIMRDSKNENQYFASAYGRNQCRILLKEDDDCIIIDQIYGHNNKGEVKGAGTELLKFAAEKSKEKGFDGKLKLKMTGSYPFYYKNNFRINPARNKNATIQNAAIDYITRTGTETSKMWKDHWAAPVVELTPENSEKLLNGERIIDKSKSNTLYSIQLEAGNRTLDAKMDFSDLDDKFVLQMIVRDSQYATLEGEIKDGKLIPGKEIKSDMFFHIPHEMNDEFKTALSIAQEIYSDNKTGE